MLLSISPMPYHMLKLSDDDGESGNDLNLLILYLFEQELGSEIIELCDFFEYQSTISTTKTK